MDENEIKILPIEEMEYGNYEIAVDDVSVQYVQTSDCTEEDGGTQTITISTRNNGVARFLNIKTGEEGWSFCNKELEQLIEDFKKRCSYKEK